VANQDSSSQLPRIGGERLPRIGGSNRLISLKDTAEFLDVPVSTLYKRWRAFGLTAYRVGRSIKFRERDIEAWLDRQRVA
jgi:excisionase family DNA binding protein